jgi:hypothetical protein
LHSRYLQKTTNITKQLVDGSTTVSGLVFRKAGRKAGRQADGEVDDQIDTISLIRIISKVSNSHEKLENI